MVRKTASLEEKQRSSAYNTAWKKQKKGTDPAFAEAYNKKEALRAHLRADTGPGYRALWLANVKRRAVKKGLAFDLELDDLVFPEFCPVLGIPLKARAGKFNDNSPSLDRIVPEKGYVKGNVVIMSYRANRIKCHASLEDLRAIVRFMEQHCLS